MNDKWLLYTRRYEGFAPIPYKCPTGHLTVGYGHNLEVPLSKDAALALLKIDFAVAEADVSRAFSWWKNLDEARQFILVDMCFNMGLARLLTFKKMLAAAERGDYQKAAREMLNSRWAKQVGRRARELAEMMQTGEEK